MIKGVKKSILLCSKGLSEIVKKHISMIIILLCLLISGTANSQEYPNNSKRILQWSLLQLVPVFTLQSDNNDMNARLITGLRWNITPINYSFNANKFVSPVEFFIVNPVRRLGGSVELFFQPDVALDEYRYSDLNRYSIDLGSRLFIPLAESGENLAMSVGAKYIIRKTKESVYNDASGVELGMYTLFGILGVKFDYNFDKNNRYNISLNLRYF